MGLRWAIPPRGLGVGVDASSEIRPDAEGVPILSLIVGRDAGVEAGIRDLEVAGVELDAEVLGCTDAVADVVS